MRKSPLKHSAEKEMWLWPSAQDIPPAPPIRQKRVRTSWEAERDLQEQVRKEIGKRSE